MSNRTDSVKAVCLNDMWLLSFDTLPPPKKENNHSFNNEYQLCATRCSGYENLAMTSKDTKLCLHEIYFPVENKFQGIHINHFPKLSNEIPK